MAGTEGTYTVTGMHCGSCALNVRDEVREVPGVTEVIVDHVSRRMTVVGADFTEAQIRAAVAEAGYAVGP
ncbi:MAG: heavy-metal-associated domain-containing protein [Thermoleophilia bacterium]|nr:heavy-metal-associated domain-containing protein [Thermoleophilia bacterium]